MPVKTKKPTRRGRPRKRRRKRVEVAEYGYNTTWIYDNIRQPVPIKKTHQRLTNIQK